MAENQRPDSNNGPAVIRATPQVGSEVSSRSIFMFMVTLAGSGVIHVVILSLFLLVTINTSNANVSSELDTINTAVEDDKPKDANLTNEDEGIASADQLLSYPVPRVEEVSVPGPVNPTERVGIQDMAEGPLKSVPPPPGFNDGQGGALEGAKPGLGSLVGLPGGMRGVFSPGGTGGRSGATKDELLRTGGGNGRSEAAVARALAWIARHQAADGHWSLDGFNQHGHCNCTGYGQNNDIAATAFGLLPLLGAGETHKADPKTHKYAKNVERGLQYLMRRQGRDGGFGGGMYAHGLASIAMCEAYGMTGDPKLRDSAQRCINYIRAAQSDSGGWRYEPRSGGDTSVVGWQVMALKSAQMAELTVDDKSNPTLAKSTKWLNSCMTSDGSGYGYQDATATPTMTAVGLLCRLYLGTGPRNAGIVGGVNRLRQYPPGSMGSMYYFYYATQVLHHVGGPEWDKWNVKMRDMLIDKQEKAGADPKHPDLVGSWSPVGDVHAGAGGRLMITSLCVLTLEVYYRHLPLYRRDAANGKTVASN
jgi:hypothetical protein